MPIEPILTSFEYLISKGRIRKSGSRAIKTIITAKPKAIVINLTKAPSRRDKRLKPRILLNSLISNPRGYWLMSRCHGENSVFSKRGIEKK
ncbi:MAG: hypothetical protein ABIG90_03185 [bacterium]